MMPAAQRCARIFLKHAALIAFACCAVASAQEAAFTVRHESQSVGTASYRYKPAEGGIESTSLVHVSMQGLNYALSKTEQLTAAHQLSHVQLSAIVGDSAVTVTGSVEGQQLALEIAANGRSKTSHLDAKNGAVFMPDFDPGALQNLLTLAAAGNNRELWAIIPKQAGTVDPVTLATYPDEEGTLDGKPIAVHHLVATVAGATTHLFSGPENQLLQAELPQEGFALVLNGFELKPPAKPIAPPAN
jgi:hypothetical protein